MSYRLTLGNVRAMCARVLDLPPNDSRVIEYVNRAQECLMLEGNWNQCTAKYRVCVRDSCLTWPREVESILAYTVCGVPGQIRSQWYEFTQFGPGLLDPALCNGNMLLDDGEACSFESPAGGITKRFAIYCDQTETTTTPVLIQSYDYNSQWVLTEDDEGNIIEGEYLPLPAKGTYTYATRNINKDGLVRVVKPITNGNVSLYEHDTSTASLRALGKYAPSEQNPTYRRSIIPGLSAVAESLDDDCGYVEVTILATLRHIPVISDNDAIMIPVADALSLECQAIRKRENNLIGEAAAHHMAAVDLLNKQLKRYRGAAMHEPMQLAPTGTYGGAIDYVV